YSKFKPKFPIALIVGNEVEGINEVILAQCDAILEIPMHGSKNSLNVSVATGIALYELTK
ncbi:MAG: TrmH family RNA methyltransferase, partial [Patescibacteria group bacterium]